MAKASRSKTASTSNPATINQQPAQDGRSTDVKAEPQQPPVSKSCGHAKCMERPRGLQNPYTGPNLFKYPPKLEDGKMRTYNEHNNTVVVLEGIPNTQAAIQALYQNEHIVQNRNVARNSQIDPVEITDAAGRKAMFCPTCCYYPQKVGEKTYRVVRHEKDFRRHHCVTKNHMQILEHMLGLDFALCWRQYQCPNEENGGCGKLYNRPDDLPGHIQLEHPLMDKTHQRNATTETVSEAFDDYVDTRRLADMVVNKEDEKENVSVLQQGFGETSEHGVGRSVETNLRAGTGIDLTAQASMSVGSASGRSNPLLNGRTRNGKKPAVKKRKTVYDGGVVKSSRKSKTNVRSSGKGPRHVDVADQAMPKEDTHDTGEGSSKIGTAELMEIDQTREEDVSMSDDEVEVSDEDEGMYGGQLGYADLHTVPSNYPQFPKPSYMADKGEFPGFDGIITLKESKPESTPIVPKVPPPYPDFAGFNSSPTKTMASENGERESTPMDHDVPIPFPDFENIGSSPFEAMAFENWERESTPIDHDVPYPYPALVGISSSPVKDDSWSSEFRPFSK